MASSSNSDTTHNIDKLRDIAQQHLQEIAQYDIEAQEDDKRRKMESQRYIKHRRRSREAANPAPASETETTTSKMRSASGYGSLVSVVHAN
jgi:hypothetical protein